MFAADQKSDVTFPLFLSLDQRQGRVTPCDLELRLLGLNTPYAGFVSYFSDYLACLRIVVAEGEDR